MIHNRFNVIMGYFRKGIFFLLLFFSLIFLCESYPKILFTPYYKNMTQQNWFDFVFWRAQDFYRNGRYKEAVKAFQTASLIARHKSQESKSMECRFYKGLCYWNLGKIEDSYTEYSQLLEMTVKRNILQSQIELKKVVEIIDLYKRGIELREDRDFEKSLIAFQKAVEAADKVSRSEFKQKILRQISITYWDKNDLSHFYHFNKLSLGIAEKMNHREEIVRCLNNIGVYYFKAFEYSKALSVYHQALDISRDLGNQKDESNILHNMGLLYKNFGYYDKALDYLEKALEIDKKTAEYEYFPIDYMNIGVVYKLKAEQENNKELMSKAVDYFKKSLFWSGENYHERIEVSSLNNIGSAYIEMDKFSEALSFLQRSLNKANEIGVGKSVSMILNNMGYVYLNTEHYGQAESFFQQALERAVKDEDYDTLWEVYFGLAQVKERGKNFPEAIENYLESIKSIETVKDRIVLDLHNASFLQRKLKVYERLMDLLFDLYEKQPNHGYGEKMFYVAERAKARVLLENLANTGVSYKEVINNQIHLTEEDHINHLNQRYVEINSTQKKVPAVFYMNEEVQSYLKNRDAVIFEYFLGEKKSYLFRVTEKELRVFPLPSEKSIMRSIQGYLKMLRSPPEGKFKGKAASQRIYKELLYPLSSLKPDSFKNIIIIPSGVLYYLPFETLVVPEQKNEYLVSKYRVSYMPSCDALIYLSLGEKRDIYQKDFFALGNPLIKEKMESRCSPSDILMQLYENQGFKFYSLPYSKKEIKSISRFFKKEKRDIFLNEDASEETLKRIQLSDYKIIHFSCHGFIDEGHPFRSSLVLSMTQRKDEDGFLQVREIYNLDMNPQLVVLSACQTGRGTLKRGEGVLGLPRVFFYRGSESVLSTLWRVKDKQAAVFMNLFYKYLASGKSRSHSLQLAKIEFIQSKKHSNPFYWAPFVLNGEFSRGINF
jgi:CHAT domain-containing protein/Tfp pilus assembly protein PilF